MTVGVGEREGVGEKEGVRVAVESVSVGDTVGETLTSSVGEGNSSVSVRVGVGVSAAVESGDGRDVVVVDSVAAADSVAAVDSVTAIDSVAVGPTVSDEGKVAPVGTPRSGSGISEAAGIAVGPGPSSVGSEVGRSPAVGGGIEPGVVCSAAAVGGEVSSAREEAYVGSEIRLAARKAANALARTMRCTWVMVFPPGPDVWNQSTAGEKGSQRATGICAASRPAHPGQEGQQGIDLHAAGGYATFKPEARGQAFHARGLGFQRSQGTL
jgi:hypothetical protein